MLDPLEYSDDRTDGENMLPVDRPGMKYSAKLMSLRTGAVTAAIQMLALAALACVTAAPAAAQPDDTAQAIYDSFESLLGSPEQRELYALPAERYWRAGVPLTVSLRGGRERSLWAPLMALADDVRKATGLWIKIEVVAHPELPERILPDSLVIVVADRADGDRFAGELGIGEEERRRFRDGRWPALVYFWRNDLYREGARAGVVIMASDITLDEQIAYLALSLVWVVGGASIGDHLGDIIDIDGRPSLTERGRRVFALMYQPELTLGQPLDVARATARRLLGLSD